MKDKFPHDPASIKHVCKLNWSGTRRTFIHNTSLIAAGAVAGALAPRGHASSENAESAIRKTPSYNPDMEYRRLDVAEAAELKQAVDEMWVGLPANYQWLKNWEYV